MLKALALLIMLSLAASGAAYAGQAGAGLEDGRYEVAIFAGGCFRCMEPSLEKLPGVKAVISGYTDGRTKEPTYENYSEGGHVEVVEVLFDPRAVSYERLLEVYWRQVNPTDSGGQFGDRGPQYRPAIFYLNDGQKALAEKSRDALAKSGKFKEPIATEIKRASRFWPAEEYHQDYHKKNPWPYKYYRYGSGRDGFLDRVWGKGGH
ncbi:MAG: peptide-methionine (S)-S-oxide reductase MsrA [Nitrospirae bacterium]|nr:peptide-methionine (S)-S-oxide reductase MsrA [Nitrospirota bacterium]